MRKHLVLAIIILAPAIMFGQTADAESSNSEITTSSPWQLDLSFIGHNIFGDAVATLPGDKNFGIGYDGAIKYQRGNIGLALSGGFWKSKYEPSASGVAFTQRLEDISAHYVMFGPYLSLGSGRTTFQINPKVGIQRFYFPAPIRSNTGINIRTDLDAGISAGLGIKALFPIDDAFSVHARLDYMTTLGDGAFKYILRNGSQVIRNEDPLQSISIGLGASMTIKSNEQNDASKSFAPTAIDISGGAGLNFLIGEGIDNLPGEKSAGYDADLTLNYRIGRSGIAITGGFWDNKYEAKEATESGTVLWERLPNLSAHYISAGPIIPVTSKGSSKLRVELVPHVGIQRIYFPHSNVQIGNSIRRVRTNLQSAWTAGLGANLMVPINSKLDLKLGADYASTLTDRAFGFTVSGVNGQNLNNRKALQRVNVGVGLAYTLLQNTVEKDEEITPEKIAEMINAKEEDKEENKGDEVIQIGNEESGDMNKEEKETAKPTETAPVVAPTPPAPVVTEQTKPATTPAPTTTAPVYSEPSTPSPIYAPTPSTNNGVNDNNTIYRVQFVALSKDAKVFNQLKQYGTVILEYYSAKGLYRYMVGDAATKAEGMTLLRKIHNNGWPKAFLVKYENGTRTRIYE